MSTLNKTFQHFNSILDQLIEDNSYFAFYFQSPFSIEDEGSLSYGYNAPRNISMYCGATRGVIADADWDEVVKFELDGYEDEVSPCAAEVSIYEAAVAANLSKCFVKPRYLGTYVKTIKAYPASLIYEHDDEDACYDMSESSFCRMVNEMGLSEEDMREVTIKLPLYAYEKANNVGWTCDEYEDEEGEIAKSYDSPLMERAEEVAASFVHEYGEVVYAELSSFLNEWCVNDLHCGNVGWINGRLVLIDYAGYHC